jgi:hypothetical protein
VRDVELEIACNSHIHVAAIVRLHLVLPDCFDFIPQESELDPPNRRNYYLEFEALDRDARRVVRESYLEVYLSSHPVSIGSAACVRVLLGHR